MAIFKNNSVKDFTKERYMTVVRSHPRLAEERTQMYLMLILTFLSLSFLGIFAINPTLTTIVELNRKLSDSEFIQSSLTTKLTNLSSLNTQYDALNNTWPVVFEAVPNDPQAVKLTGQIQSMAKNSQVTVSDIQIFTVELTKSTQKPLIPKQASFVFSVSADGQKANLMQFAKSLADFNRVVEIESVSYENLEKESITIKGRVFFTI